MELARHISLGLTLLKPAPPKRHPTTWLATVLHYGVLGLFALSIVDSSPLPTFAGPDILTAILAARHRQPWYYFVLAATTGSVLGALFTYRVARHAGSAYLEKLGRGKFASLQHYFEKWGAGALIVSCAVPLPFPTSTFFAAAGASKYPLSRFLPTVAISRGIRYAAIALIADHYGRSFVRAIRHPGQYWQWLVLLAGGVAGLAALVIYLHGRLSAGAPTGAVAQS